MNTKATFLTLAVLTAVSLLYAQQPASERMAGPFPAALPGSALPDAVGFRSVDEVYLLDSVKSPLKWYYKYDAKGRLVQETYQSQPPGSEIYWERTDYLYAGKPDSNFLTTTESTYSAPQRKWIALEQKQETYVPSQLRHIIHNLNWNFSKNEFSPSDGEEETFFPNGMRRSYAWLQWDSSRKMFVPQDREEYEADSAYRITTERHYSWNTTLSSETRFRYDEQGRLTTRTTQVPHFDGTAVILFVVDSTIFSYTEDAQVATAYTRTTEQQTWRLEDRRTVKKDQRGNEIYHMIERPDTSSASGWINYVLQTQLFDAAGHLLRVEGYSWDKQTQAWVGGIQYKGEWNAYGHILSEEVPESFKWEYTWTDFPEPVTVLLNTPAPVKTLQPESVIWHGLLVQRTISDWDSGQWVIDQVRDYFFNSRVITAVPNIEAPVSLQADPNPTTGLLTLTLEGVDLSAAVATLTDLSGRLIRRFTPTWQMQVDLSGLPDGIYLLQVNVPGYEPVTRKVVKQDIP